MRHLALLLFLGHSCVQAAEPASAPGSQAFAQGLMLAAFGIIVYFMIIRPQSKRAKEHQQLINQLKLEDEIVTSGGIIGKIARIQDNFLFILIAEGVEVPVQKHAVVSSIPKGTLKSLRTS